MVEFLKGLTQLHNLFYSVLWFVVILTVLVFVHEFGHYIIARWNRVRIEVFSIGFGPELFGSWDRAGARWKFSTIPLGGYVKMFGDSDATSGLPAPGLSRLSEVERGVSFHYKRLGQRAAIVAAGDVPCREDGIPLRGPAVTGRDAPGCSAAERWRPSPAPGRAGSSRG